MTLLEGCVRDFLFLPDHSFYHVGTLRLEYNLKLLKLPSTMFLVSKDFFFFFFLEKMYCFVIKETLLKDHKILSSALLSSLDLGDIRYY